MRQPGIQVVVKPVIDLADQINVAAYEIPDRLRVQRGLIDHHCVFPWCTRPARSNDIDHITPHDHGGDTSTDNIAPLCRGHHRAKTHTRWDYDRLDDTTYIWRSPNGLFFRADHHGTTPITPANAPPGET